MFPLYLKAAKAALELHIYEFCRVIGRTIGSDEQYDHDEAEEADPLDQAAALFEQLSRRIDLGLFQTDAYIQKQHGAAHDRQIFDFAHTQARQLLEECSHILIRDGQEHHLHRVREVVGDIKYITDQNDQEGPQHLEELPPRGILIDMQGAARACIDRTEHS